MICREISPGAHVFGYYKTNPQCTKLHAFGTIPLIGIISGIVRISIFSLKMERHIGSDTHKDFHKAKKTPVHHPMFDEEIEGQPRGLVVSLEETAKNQRCIRTINYVGQILRGVLEILCLGILLLFIDIIASYIHARRPVNIVSIRVTPLPSPKKQ